MKELKYRLAIITVLQSINLLAQSVSITSFNQNPLEVSPLLGADLTINFTYSSQAGASSNHIYVGLEELDANNQFVRTVSGKSLKNETAGNTIQKSVSLFVGSSNRLSADLPTGHYYQALVRLYDTNWNELASAGYWNTPMLTIQNTVGYNFSTKTISKGADISWMTEMESNGFTWKDNNGNSKELMPLLKEYDISAVRLRVWVNPSISGANGWCDITDMVAKAEKAKNNGLDVMVCIHYSDWWADPGKQNKPNAWKSMSVAQLETAVANHTTDILNALQAKGITPKWMQIGNETNNGMLWTTGKASTGGFANYAKFLNAGANAVKTFNNNIKTIIHIAGGNNNSLMRWNIDGLLSNGFQFSKFDIIAMSSYPGEDDWKQQVEDTYDNMVDLKSRYNKEIMMAEVGFSNKRQDIAYQYLTYMIEKVKQADGVGIFYWEPIAHKGWKSYNKGAWDDDGSPSIAMDAFLDKSALNLENNRFENEVAFKVFPNPTSEILHIHSFKNIPVTAIKIIDIGGRIVKYVTAKKSIKTIRISELANGLYFIKVNNFRPVKFIKN